MLFQTPGCWQCGILPKPCRWRLLPRCLFAPDRPGKAAVRRRLQTQKCEELSQRPTILNPFPGQILPASGHSRPLAHFFRTLQPKPLALRTSRRFLRSSGNLANHSSGTGRKRRSRCGQQHRHVSTDTLHTADAARARNAQRQMKPSATIL